MTENRSTPPLFCAECQAQLARLPAAVQEALHASAKAAEQAVQEERIQLLEVNASLCVMLQSELGVRAVEGIGAATMEAAFRALQSGQVQGRLR